MASTLLAQQQRENLSKNCGYRAHSSFSAVPSLVLPLQPSILDDDVDNNINLDENSSSNQRRCLPSTQCSAQQSTASSSGGDSTSNLAAHTTQTSDKYQQNIPTQWHRVQQRKRTSQRRGRKEHTSLRTKQRQSVLTANYFEQLDTDKLISANCGLSSSHIKEDLQAEYFIDDDVELMPHDITSVESSKRSSSLTMPVTRGKTTLAAAASGGKPEPTLAVKKKDKNSVAMNMKISSNFTKGKGKETAEDIKKNTATKAAAARKKREELAAMKTAKEVKDREERMAKEAKAQAKMAAKAKKQAEAASKKAQLAEAAQARAKAAQAEAERMQLALKESKQKQQEMQKELEAAMDDSFASSSASEGESISSEEEGSIESVTNKVKATVDLVSPDAMESEEKEKPWDWSEMAKAAADAKEDAPRDVAKLKDGRHHAKIGSGHRKDISLTMSPVKKEGSNKRMQLQQTPDRGGGDDESMGGDDTMEGRKLFSEEDEGQQHSAASKPETTVEKWLRKKKEESVKNFGENISPLRTDNLEFLPGAKGAPSTREAEEEVSLLFGADGNGSSRTGGNAIKPPAISFKEAVNNEVTPAAPSDRSKGFSIGTASTLTSNSSSLRNSSYKGVAHRTVPPIDGKSPLTPLFTQPGAPPQRGYVQVGFPKAKDTDIQDVLAAHVAALLELLQSVCPSLVALCQTDGLRLPPLESHEIEKGFPTKSGVLLQYFHVPAKKMWQLSAPPREPEEGKEQKPDMAIGTMLFEAPTDIQMLLASQMLEIRSLKMDVRWKNIQERESDLLADIFAVPPWFCPIGVQAVLELGMERTERKIAKSNTPAFDFVGEPFPSMNVFFRAQRDSKLPSAEYKELTMNNIPGFKDHGCRVLAIEMAPTAWLRCKPILDYMHDKGTLQKILGRRAYKSDASMGRLTIAKTIDQQRNKRAHLEYCEKLTYIELKDIVTADKLVEAIRLDGKQASPKFVSLRSEFMDLKCPTGGFDMIEAIIPCKRGPSAGMFEVSMRRNNSERNDILKNMATNPAAWWHQWWTKKYSTSTVEKLMDSFDLDARSLAGLSTFDFATMKVTSEFAARMNFADEMSQAFALEELPDNAVGTEKVDIATAAREELMEKAMEQDTLSFGSKDGAASRRSNFSQSTGNSTNRSTNTERFRAEHKNRALENVELRKKCAEMQQKQAEVEARERELQARIDALEKASMHCDGAPPDSGSSAAGLTLQSQNTDDGRRAAEQG